MQVHFGVELLRAEWHRAVACVGTFDGVHLGHQAVISTAIDQAREREVASVLVTFDRHPAHTLHPESCPKAIASLDGNLRQFEALGVAIAVILPFDFALSQTSAADFLESILENKLRAESLVVGHDFALGRGREGDSAWLAQRIETTVVPPYEMEGRRVSSSDIRRAVTEGRVADAGRWLGRPFEIPGVVVAGERIGRTLGYPTINLARSFDQVLPADGVYAGWCETPFGDYRAAASIGTRPTFGGATRTIEAYLIEYPGHAIYGAPVRLRLHDRIRDELAFESTEDLKRQMALDVELAGRDG